MMNFEEFSEAVLKEIKEKAEGKFDVSMTINMKNNGIKCTGISAIARESSNGPCIYLDGYYQEYKNRSMELHSIADQIYRQIIEHQNDFHDIKIMDFLNWKNIKGSIYAKLINAEQNREQLDVLPHRMFLDLAVVYYAAVSGFESQCISTILIHNRHLSIWKQSEEELYQLSVINMRSEGNPVFDNMETILKGAVPETASIWDSSGFSLNLGAYILTNHHKHFGASEILDKNVLKKVSDMMKGDFIILPSSVHEVIILPSKYGVEFGGLADMVKEINATEVSAEDYLSDHVYIYSKSEETLKIAA